MFRRAAKSDVQAPWEDPTALSRFGQLEVVARLIVEGYMMGQHKSPFKGSSIEFVEHRQYYPGDEIRHIDWRAFGKTGKYYIKEFEDETNLRCHLLVDASGSMGFADQTLSKFAYARLLALSLGHLLLLQRDAVGLTTFDTQPRDTFQPSTNPQTFHRLVEMMKGRKPGGETSLADVLEEILPTIKRRSLIVLISDCFDDLQRLVFSLQQLRHRHHEVIVFQVVAPEEEEFPFNKPTRFDSMERSRDKKLVDPHRLRTHYLKQYREFCTELARQCGSLAIDYEKIVTTQPYQHALGTFLASRTRKSRQHSIR